MKTCSCGKRIWIALLDEGFSMCAQCGDVGPALVHANNSKSLWVCAGCGNPRPSACWSEDAEGSYVPAFGFSKCLVCEGTKMVTDFTYDETVLPPTKKPRKPRKKVAKPEVGVGDEAAKNFKKLEGFCNKKVDHSN